MNTLVAYNDLKTILRVMEGIVFYQDSAPKNAVTPYVVFRLESMVDTSPTTNATLKFMCYDDRNKLAKANIEIADKIHHKFNKTYRVFDIQSYHSVLNIRQVIPSEYLTDKQCIEMQFDVVIYNR